MGFQILSLNLKIWPEVEFWSFLCMRSRKLGKILETVVQFSQFLLVLEIWHVDLKSKVKFYTFNSGAVNIIRTAYYSYICICIFYVILCDFIAVLLSIVYCILYCVYLYCINTAASA